IYTSGTTGDPKGVLLSHSNFCSNVLASYGGFPVLSSRERCISILPWAHSYAQTVELYTFTYLGASIGIMGSTATLVQDMAQVRPTFVIAVPRVFNKIYDALKTAMNEKGGLAKKLFFMGIESARKRRESKGNLLNDLKFRLADRIVFQKIRDRFPLYEAYGMTEASPGISANCPAANRMGSVGRPLPGVRIVIDTSVVEDGATDGEIIVYGPNVMQGYHNKPEQTREAITPDGGLRTGDRGRVDADGYLYITGRIKEQFKLENGKFIFPASLEEDIMFVPWVQNALIYGENRRYTICLVVPDFF
ncbi:MAG: AMP-binding protein, partial [Deltaproteobacteria bacterium]|nr:AMP-binding protein [Deltaproteobacteria bacterium]